MQTRPHAAARLEDSWHRRVESQLRKRGWGTEAIAYTSYGSPEFVRIMGRIKMRQAGDAEQPAPEHDLEALRPENYRLRGWRNFVTPPPSMNATATIRFGHRTIDVHTDRGGYIDERIENHDLPPGWHDFTITSDAGHVATGRVVVIGPSTTHAIVSDLDDTVISTMLPRAFIAAWNTFVVHSNARHAVPGMAPLYRELREHYGQDTPVVYLSTGAWNTADTLARFLVRHGFPAGPMLLTDWGPTNSGWFRSGQEHKRSSLRRLWQDFPSMRWILVGDDGQHDPKLYGDFAEDHPDVVEFIALRELTPAEQVLSHGLPLSNEELTPMERINARTPVFRAPDGYALARRIKRAWQDGDAGARPRPRPGLSWWLGARRA